MKYAKLINSYPSFAPNPILHDGLWYGNPPGSVYESEGYKLVTYTDPPSDAPSGYVWSETWTETGTAIVQGWELVEKPDEVDADEAMEILFGGGDV